VEAGQDGEVYFINYWYPQMAVYDDINGWQTDQYLGTAESSSHHCVPGLSMDVVPWCGVSPVHSGFVLSL